MGFKHGYKLYKYIMTFCWCYGASVHLKILKLEIVT